jgi:hypothetical protein
MASKYWIKLYHEILQDPKMGRLPDNVWRRAIELFLLAGELDEEGKLPETEEIAWLLRRPSIETFEAELAHLEKVGILSRLPDGWLVTKFAERQAASTDADRMKEYRKRKQKGQFLGSESEKPPAEEQKEPEEEKKVPPESEKEPESGQKPEHPLHGENGTVTEPVTTPVTERNADTESDKELIQDEEESHARTRKERERQEKVEAVMKLYCDNINLTVNPITSQEMLSDEFLNLPLLWWEEAVKIASDNNIRKWSYIRGILSRSIQRGLSPAKVGPPTQQGVPTNGRKPFRQDQKPGGAAPTKQPGPIDPTDWKKMLKST